MRGSKPAGSGRDLLRACLRAKLNSARRRVGALIGVVLFLEILFGLGVLGGNSATLAWAGKAVPAVLAVDNTRAIGRVLYTQYFYLFQVAGLVLLVAMIGAIVLTLRSRPGVRRQRISEQLYRPKDETITVVKVPTRGGV